MTEIITDEKMMGEHKVVGFMENVARDACRDVFIALCTSLKSYLMSRIVLKKKFWSCLKRVGD